MKCSKTIRVMINSKSIQCKDVFVFCYTETALMLICVHSLSKANTSFKKSTISVYDDFKLNLTFNTYVFYLIYNS